jgi:hypothetical protein
MTTVEFNTEIALLGSLFQGVGVLEQRSLVQGFLYYRPFQNSYGCILPRNIAVSENLGQNGNEPHRKLLRFSKIMTHQ